ncbi:MAG TPA: hypothetical protein VK705_04275 [Ferruginibacter sp.]|jgi:hypothetical protein|nr:hypothetical protein [Ferruginibacter sp.]
MVCKINNIGLERIRYVRKQGLLNFFLLIPYFILLIFLFHHFLGKDGKVFFYAVMFPFWCLWILISFFSTIRWVNRHGNLIREINLETNNVEFICFSILWIDERIYKIALSEIALKNYDFGWITTGKRQDKKSLNGIKILIEEDKKALYLVKDYFDNYTEIVSCLTINK